MLGFVRIFLTVLTVIAVSLASAVTATRWVFEHSDWFEGQIRTYFHNRDIEIQGLSGDWYRLNPVLSVERITTEGFDLFDVRLEVDTLESLVRNRIVAAELVIGDGNVYLEHTAGGWGLRTAEHTQPGPDVYTTVWHSDVHSINLVVNLERGTTRSAYRARVQAENRDDFHRWRASVSPVDHEANSGLVLDVDVVANGGEPTINANLEIANLPIDLSLLGIEDISRTVVSTSARFVGTSTDAASRILGSVLFENENEPVGITGVGLLTVQGDRWRGVVGNLHSEFDGVRDVLNDVYFARNDEQSVVWTQMGDVETYTQLISQLLGSDSTASQWIRGMQLEGEVEQLVVLKDASGTSVHSQWKWMKTESFETAPGLTTQNISMVASSLGCLARFSGADTVGSLPHMFDREWQYSSGEGTAICWIGPERFALHTPDLRLYSGPAPLQVGLSFSRARRSNENNLVVTVATAAIEATDMLDYLPTTLDEVSRKWVRQSLTTGTLTNGRGALVRDAQIGKRPTVLHLNGTVQFDDAVMSYDDRWPPLTNGRGALFLRPDQLALNIDTVSTYGETLKDGRVRMSFDEGVTIVEFRSMVDAGTLLDFVRETPLHEVLPVVSPEWKGSGSIDLAVSLELRGNPAGLDVSDYSVQLSAEAMDLNLADLRLPLTDLSGNVVVNAPHVLTGSGITGKLFEKPVVIDVLTTNAGHHHGLPEAIRFDVEGTASIDDVYNLLDFEIEDLATGAAKFSARVWTYPESDFPVEVDVQSDLQGVAIALPTPVGKSGLDSASSTLQMIFHDQYTESNVNSKGISGWVHTLDDEILRGNIGIGAPPGTVQPEDGELIVTGALDRFDVAASGSTDVDVKVRMHELTVGTVHLGDFDLSDVVVHGFVSPDELQFSVTSSEIDGEISQRNDEPWIISLSQIAVEADESSDGDPLDTSVFDVLLPAHVSIESALVKEGDDVFDYGSWTFSLEPTESVLHVRDLRGEITGMQISSAEDLRWDRETDRTYFNGSVTGGDLAEVLDAWDFEVSVVSNEFDVDADLNWAGSPLAFALERVSGRAEIAVNEGSFEDVEQVSGAVRVASLFNFSQVLRRLQLDLSDVVQKGLSYDSIRLSPDLNEGIVSMNEPAVIEGTGALFRFVGTLDLKSNRVDGQMIVTLPIEQSLPWYHLWLAMANPAAGVGVAMATRLFENEIGSLSSGRYRVTGDLEDPTVELIGLFDSRLKIPESEAEDRTRQIEEASID